MKKSILFLAFVLVNSLGISQEIEENTKQTVVIEPKVKATIAVVYPYLWRGIRYYGNKVAFQPNIEYSFTDKLRFNLWASTNFSNAADAYNEFDWSFCYQISPVVSVTLADYYWPATANNPDWEKSSYFDYSEGSSQSMDLSLSFDFSEKGVPLRFEWNTFVAGNDFNYDANGKATTRAFSSYAEVGYTYLHQKSDIGCRVFVGAVVINGGYYGTDANGQTGFTFSNIGVSIDKEIKITKKFSLPVFIQYQNTDYGIREFDSENGIKTTRNFFSCGMTFTVL